jgi:LacI family transcriptional regulator
MLPIMYQNGEQKMPVTMRDVALRVGVSKQTISAVLNGKPGISAETIARVKQAVQELGYHPNMVASSLRHGHTNTIGLILSNVTNPWYAELARGVEDVAQSRGYSVMLCNTYDSRSRTEEYLRVLTRQRTAGVIGFSEEDARSIVANTSCMFQTVQGTDSVRGAYVACAHLLDLGHRRIACITSTDSSGDVSSDRLKGYVDVLTEWGVAIDDDLIVTGAFDYASGLRAVETLLQRTDPPTAIFAHQDLAAIGAIAGLKRAGLRVPADVAVIGYDGLEIAALYDPPLSTIVQPVYEMGRQAMTQLADKLEGLPVVDLQPLDCTLVVRQSTVPTLTQEWFSPPISADAPWRGWRNERTAS